MQKRKIAWTLITVLAIVLAASGVVDDAAEEYAEDAFRRALVTFAVARTLNGVISLAQGTELALEPGGVGVNLGVGEVLDPINDLVEQFSGVMLVATSSLGLQNVLLKMTRWWGFTAALCVAGAAAILLLWWPGMAERRYVVAGTRVLVLMLTLRFIVPSLIIATNTIATHFLEPEQRTATAALEATSATIEDLNAGAAPALPPGDESFMDRLGTTLRDTWRSMDVEARLERLRSATANASEHIVNLIVLFVLQTIILPIVFVWLVMEILKGAISRGASRST